MAKRFPFRRSLPIRFPLDPSKHEKPRDLRGFFDRFFNAFVFGSFLSAGVLPIGSWGGAEFPFEVRVELGEVREANLRGDLADGDGAVDEEARGVAELRFDEVFVGRAAEILFEEAVQLDARVVEPLAEVCDRIKQERGLQGELVHGARERGFVLGHLNHVEIDPLDGEQGGGFGDVVGLKAR